MKRDKRVDHAAHSHDREQCCCNQARSVAAEIQEADREAAEDDGEVEPGEEGAFVCEEDFGFDAGGEGDAFPGGGLEEGLGGHCCGRKVSCCFFDMIYYGRVLILWRSWIIT